jgi:acyl-CoA dehydrogenase
MNAFLFHQGAARRLSKVWFHDRHAAYADAGTIPDVAGLFEQAEALADLLRTSAPGEEQARDTDLSLSVGEIFPVIRTTHPRAVPDL